jgi:hypothetical protein
MGEHFPSHAKPFALEQDYFRDPGKKERERNAFLFVPRNTERDFSFEVPQEWHDGSIVVFHGPDDVSVVVTQEPVPEGETLRRQADRELIQLGKSLREFDLLESHDTELGGRPAIHMRFTWVSARGTLEQSMTLVHNEREGACVATVFATAVPQDKAAAMRPIFEHLLESVAFDEPAPPPSRSTPTAGVAVEPPPLDIPIPGTLYRRP